MITSEQSTAYPRETRSLVHQISMALFQSLDTVAPNKQLSIESLQLANRHGVMPQVKRWHAASHLTQQSIEQAIQQSATGDDLKQLMSLLQAGDAYWSVYSLVNPSFSDIINHSIAYSCAKQVHDGACSQPDYYKVYQSLTLAANNCLIKQTQAAFTSFFSESSIESRVSSAFSGDESSKLLTIVSSGETTHSCTASPVVVESIRGDGTGDDSTGSRVETFAGGSARVPSETPVNIKTNAPFEQHLTHAATLNNILITSDQAETLADSLDHVRLGSIHDQITCSSDYIDQITQFYTQDIMSTQENIDDQTEINKKRNDFMQSQLAENMLLIKNSDNRATVEDKNV